MATAKKAADEFKFPDEKDENGAIEATVAKPGEGEDVEVEVIDDTPPKDRGRKPLEKEVKDPTDEELDDYTKGVRQRIKDLTHARHDERREKERLQRERDELERMAATALEENKRLRQTYNAGAQAFAQTSKEAADAALVAAKAKLKKAHEDFDTDAIADAQAEIAEAALRVQQAKNFRVPPLQEENDEVQTRQQQHQAAGPDQKTLNWQAKNQWFGAQGFEEYTSYALGLHQRLVNSGVDPRSDEYFARIDARMKQAFPELYDSDGEDDADTHNETSQRAPAKKPPTVVAPAARTPAGPGKVRLTQTQVALAKKFGLTPQQYAAQVVKLQKENA